MEVLGKFIVVIDPDVPLVAQVPVDSGNKYFPKGLIVVNARGKVSLLIAMLFIGCNLGGLFDLKIVLEIIRV